MLKKQFYKNKEEFHEGLYCKNKIGLGTAAIGRPLYINVKQNVIPETFSLPKFKENGLQVLDAAYTKGIRHFDTAPGYGIAEELMVKWLKEKNDPNITVSTKWGYTYVANFDSNAKVHEVKEHSLANLNTQWKFSKQLIPYLKVYQIHSATIDTEVLNNTEVLKRLHELKKENKITIGLTTTGANQTEVLEEALGIQVENEALFQSFQCTFNILDQSLSKYTEVLENRSGPFIIKEALANGRLIPNENFPDYTKLYELMTKLGKKYVVGADAIALRYCMEIFPKAIVLSGANNSNHLEANLKVNQFKLTTNETEKLSAFGINSEDYWQERKQLTWN